jgi:thymidine phosphorylase
MSSHNAPIPKALKARRLGIETLEQAHVFIRRDSDVCRAEGLSAHNRVLVSAPSGNVIATLFPVSSDFLSPAEIGISNWAWQSLHLTEGESVSVTHAPPVTSLNHLRSKVFGHPLSAHAFDEIMRDVVAGRYSNIQLSSFVTACAAKPLNHAEICSLTRAMVAAGETLKWDRSAIMDKHSVGGLPGNRTTPIVVAIVAASGLAIPKTSSRAITSPAGTADTMETMAPVDLDVTLMRRVVEKEGGCIAWGGAMRLSPADDLLIRIERALDVDAEGQMIASILSKKIAAGATHLAIDMPVGPTAKIRSHEAARSLASSLKDVATHFGLVTNVLIADGEQPVGRGIGPVLEALDVLAVLQDHADAPSDLREHALVIAGSLLELGGLAKKGEGAIAAEATLRSGAAWQKFQAICEAQGGMRHPVLATEVREILSPHTGIIDRIDNRRLSRVAKLAGAPEDKAAGLRIHARLGEMVIEGQPLFTLYAQTRGQIEYALEYVRANGDIVGIAVS